MIKEALLIFLLPIMPAVAQTVLQSTAAPIKSAYAFQIVGEGVTTQVNSGDANWSPQTIYNAMSYLGVLNFRDAAFADTAAQDLRFEQVADDNGASTTALARMTLLMAASSDAGTANLDTGSIPLAARLLQASALNTAVPGMIQALEGANEINNQPIEYDGYGTGCVAYYYSHGPLAACTSQYELEAANAADHAITVYAAKKMKNVTSYYFTGYENYLAGTNVFISRGPNPSLSPGYYSVYDNSHPYAQNGSPPNYWMNRTGANSAYPNENNVYASPPYISGKQPATLQPAVATEDGYSVGTTGLGYGSTVTADVAGKQDMMIYLDGLLEQNLHQIYIYKLFDEDVSGNGYGLMSSTDAPTPAAMDIHGMNEILHDAGSQAQSFTPSMPDWSISYAGNNGLYGPIPVYAATIAESNGTYLVPLWQEAQLIQNGAQVAAPVVNITLTAPGAGEIQIYDPTAADPLTPVQTEPGASIVASVSDHPVFALVTP